MIHKVREALDAIRRDGWVYHSTVGSHRHFVHPRKSGRVTVAGKDSAELAPKTWSSILKQAGLR